MLNEQEQQLLDSQSNNGLHFEQTNQHDRIKNVRITKQLEYLKKEKYTLKVDEKDCTILTFPNFYQSDNSSENEISLVMVLPSKYPFSEPTYRIIGNNNNSHQIQEEINQSQSAHKQNRPISSVLDFWSPKYKVLELIELLRIKLKQKSELQTKLSSNSLFTLINKPQYSSKQSNFIYLVLLLAILFRILIAFGGYSGKNDWPHLGDFEAHRNWMSITLNKPITQWYYQEMEDPWWRIDYPPVAAYLSLLFAEIYKFIEPKALQIQQGYESQNLTAFMRFSSLLVDIMFMIPANILIFQHFNFKELKHQNFGIYMLGLFLILIKPDQLFIDHGHFQYNSITLGLILYAFYCLLTQRYYLCCILYTIAVNCKQMAIYFGFAFLAVLVGVNLKMHYNSKNRKARIMIELGLYGALVIGTTILIWLPWLRSYEDFKNVVSAIFPIHRGLYQLKVPNFWCISDTVFKWQNLLSKNHLMIICMVISLMMSLPSLLALIIRPSKKIILFTFSAISMTFFMFSYHGHQKSILLPLVMLPYLSQYIGSEIVTDLIIGGCVGLHHLLVEDKQTLSYFVFLGFYLILRIQFQQCETAYNQIYCSSIHTSTNIEKVHKRVYNPSFRVVYTGLILICLHICKYVVEPPEKLPYLYNLLFALYSFVLNMYYLLVVNLTIFEEINKYLRKKYFKEK